MPEKQTPSYFIPKQTQGVVPARVQRKKKFHGFSFIATVLLLGSVMLAGFTYFYDGYSKTALAEEKQKLADARARFNEADIASVQELDRRLRAAEYLIDRHIALSKVFDGLELTTKQSVQFTGFAFTQRPSTDATLEITGGTEDFKKVALQSMVYNRDSLFKNAIFTDLGTTELSENPEEATTPEHRVGFDVLTNIPSSAIAYEAFSVVVEDESFEDTGTSTDDSI